MAIKMYAAAILLLAGAAYAGGLYLVESKEGGLLVLGIVLVILGGLLSWLVGLVANALGLTPKRILVEIARRKPGTCDVIGILDLRLGVPNANFLECFGRVVNVEGTGEPRPITWQGREGRLYHQDVDQDSGEESYKVELRRRQVKASKVGTVLVDLSGDLDQMIVACRENSVHADRKRMRILGLTLQTLGEAQVLGGAIVRTNSIEVSAITRDLAEKIEEFILLHSSHPKGKG